MINTLELIAFGFRGFSPSSPAKGKPTTSVSRIPIPHNQDRMTTSKTLPLLRDDVTLSAALRRDDDVIHKLSLPPKRIDFYFHLYEHRSDIESFVSFHLGLSLTETCYISEVTDWIAGSFIPVHVTCHTRKNLGQATRVLVRIPLPYKVGEKGNLGNADEKLRCEAATYLWMQQKNKKY